MTRISLDQVNVRFPLFAMKAGADAGAGIGRLVARNKQAEVHALEDISFELNEGDRVALIGRNGAGKTTLLKVLAGIFQPQSGIVKIEGHIGALLSLGYGVRIDATGRRNILLRAMMAGLSRREAEERVDEIADFAELGDFIDLPLRSYSSGMMMRISFAVATAFQPEILLLDETIGTGDAKFIEKSKRRIDTLIEDAGIAVIASHSPDFVSSMCSKAVWLHEGHIVRIGDPDETYQDYLASLGD
ncbi:MULTISPECIES: ABC transporter ATP-binding protein [Hyphobacterium]|uniref:ABC transporter ATP-binding protein n=1 Tax=Hyphobacterium vulgare TaxID=1736751 RepID=A0ABV6ZVI8_9PROT